MQYSDGRVERQRVGLTDAQRASAQQAARAATERQRKIDDERKQAKDRAAQLLDSNLTDAQRSDLKRDGFFFVDSLHGNKYRIRRGRAGNVDRMKDCGKNVSHRLCAHPMDYIPDSDTMLAQKLLLEHDEDEFLRAANRM
jgi:hypothetical protein